MTENDIGYRIIGACFKVYNALGPGLLESAYEKALIMELSDQGLKVDCQVPISIMYKNVSIGVGYKADIVVESKVIIELKSVETLMSVHHRQLLTYLRLSNMKLGYLVNFNTDNIKDNIFRYANNL
jgi:GxxExxY protein